jgi:hypothetical protein
MQARLDAMSALPVPETVPIEELTPFVLPAGVTIAQFISRLPEVRFSMLVVFRLTVTDCIEDLHPVSDMFMLLCDINFTPTATQAGSIRCF